jgi:hypothetical protein
MDSQGGDGRLFSRRNSMDISPLYAAVVALIGGAADAGRDGHAGDLLGVARKHATVLARARRARDKSPPSTCAAGRSRRRSYGAGG